MPTNKTHFVLKNSSDIVPKNVISVIIYWQITKIPDRLNCHSKYWKNYMWWSFLWDASCSFTFLKMSIIGKWAFYLCSSLTSIAVPLIVSSIGYAIFRVWCVTTKTNLWLYLSSTHAYMTTMTLWLHIPSSILPQWYKFITNNHSQYLAPATYIYAHLNWWYAHDTPIHPSFNSTATFGIILLLKVAQPHVASIRNALNNTPLVKLLESKSKQCNTFHEDGQLLPLVGLFKWGLDFDTLEMIWAFVGDVMGVVSKLASRDDASGLLPFLYGASLPKCRLDIVYELTMVYVDFLVDF
jgi:hypothetical protein